MTEEKEQDDFGAQEVDTNTGTVPPVNTIMIRKQFVKDISFECPNSPAILEVREKPEMDVNFNMNATPTGTIDNDDLFEVTFELAAQAKRGGQIAFIAEILYGLEVRIPKTVPEGKKHALLYIEAPRYAFPFVRLILSNTTQMAGFPPLLLTPVDFKYLYMERFGKDAQIIEDQAQESA